jgi:hypothetical protein
MTFYFMKYNSLFAELFQEHWTYNCIHVHIIYYIHVVLKLY